MPASHHAISTSRLLVYLSHFSDLACNGLQALNLGKLQKPREKSKMEPISAWGLPFLVCSATHSRRVCARFRRRLAGRWHALRVHKNQILRGRNLVDQNRTTCIGTSGPLYGNEGVWEWMPCMSALPRHVLKIFKASSSPTSLSCRQT